MYQFGRHLANPLRQPIFDQHTHRAHRLMVAITKWKSRKTFEKLFEGKVGIARGDALRPGALGEYLRWWNDEIARHLPEETVERSAAISAIDRLLFCLGKAAKLQINA